ncbi:MAG: tyrosine-type recombinase/integrase [Propionibacteriaceae bacterium]|jgi:integrase
MASVKQLPTGVWRARYRDEVGKEHARHFARKTDGQRWLDEITTSMVTGQYVSPVAGKITFRSFYADWSQRQIWQSGTVRAFDLAVRGVTFGDLALNRVRKSHIEQWVKSLQVAGLAPGTVRTRFDNVARIFHAAIEDRVIAFDPTKGVKLPAVRRQEAAMTIPTPEQVGELITAAEPDFAPFLAFCAFAGLRLGEAAGVRVKDIDFLGRKLQVTRQVQWAPGGNVEIRAPKYGSERTVYLPDELLIILSELIARRGIAGDQWLFVDGRDNPLVYNAVWTRYRLIRKRTGIDGFRVHDLRHFYASGLIAAGCDVVTVQRAMGHASATVTLRTYAHLWPTAEDRTRSAAADLMRTADSSRTGENASAL